MYIFSLQKPCSILIVYKSMTMQVKMIDISIGTFKMFAVVSSQLLPSVFHDNVALVSQ